MLQTLRRRQKGLMLIVAVVVIIAFAWLYNRQDLSGPSRSTKNIVMEVGGEALSLEEFRRINRKALLASRLFPNRGAEASIATLFAGPRGEQLPAEVVVANYKTIEQAADKYGVRASEAAILETQRALPDFLDGNEYSQVKFDAFKETFMTGGLNNTDLLEVIGLQIEFKKLHELATGNIHVPTGEIDFSYDVDSMEITASAAFLDREKLEEQVKVTDEEISTYFDENKADYETLEKRGFSYVFFEYPKNPTPTPAAPPFKINSTQTTPPVKITPAPNPTPGAPNNTPPKTGENEKPDPAKENPAPTPAGGEKTTPAPAPGDNKPAGTDGNAPAPGADTQPASSKEGTPGADGDEGNAGEPPADAPKKPAATTGEDAAIGEAGAKPVPVQPEVTTTPLAGEGTTNAKPAEGAVTPNIEIKPAPKTPTIQPAPVPSTGTPVDPSVGKKADPPAKVYTPTELEELKADLDKNAKMLHVRVSPLAESKKAALTFEDAIKQLKLTQELKKVDLINGRDLFKDPTKDDKGKPVEGAEDPYKDIRTEYAFLQELYSPTRSMKNKTGGIVPVDGKGVYVFRLTAVEEPKEMTLEQAKEQITKKLRNDKVEELAKEEIRKLRDTISAAIKGGKSFADAAKEAGLEAETLKDMSMNRPPRPTNEKYSRLGPAIYNAARVTPEGGLAILEKVDHDGDKTLQITLEGKEKSILASPQRSQAYAIEAPGLVHVESKKLFEDPLAETRKRGNKNSAERNLKESVFAAWFSDRAKEADAEVKNESD